MDVVEEVREEPNEEDVLELLLSMDADKGVTKESNEEEAKQTFSSDSGNDSDSLSKELGNSPLRKQNIIVSCQLNKTKDNEKLHDSSPAEVILESVQIKTEPETIPKADDGNGLTRTPTEEGEPENALSEKVVEGSLITEQQSGSSVNDDTTGMSNDLGTEPTVVMACKTEYESEMDNNITVPVVSVVSELMEYRGDSSGDESGGETSDSSDDESGPESGFHPGSSGEEISDGEAVPKTKKNVEEASEKVPSVNRIVKTKGEMGLEDLPPLEDLQIVVEKSVRMYEVGSVNSCVGLLVVVQGLQDAPALNVDSILFLDNKQVLGKVFEILGPVAKPLYTVRFNKVEDIEEKGIKVGTLVFYAPDKDEYTKFVFLNELKKMKGSDASWEHNNEPPAKCLDYSDDEAERRAKRGDRGEGGSSENTKSGKRNKDRGGRFNQQMQDGSNTDRSGNHRNASKRGRNSYQSWPPKPGDFSENSADFPQPPAPPREFPNDYPGFHMQQARVLQPDNNCSFRGPCPTNTGGFQGPPPSRQHPSYRGPSFPGNQPFRASHHGNNEFRGPPNGDLRLCMNTGNQPGFQPQANRPPFTDQPHPNFAGPPHQFGGGPPFNNNPNRFPQPQRQPSFPPQQCHGNTTVGNPNGNTMQNRTDFPMQNPQWTGPNQPRPAARPTFFGPPHDARPPPGPSSFHQACPPQSVPQRYPQQQPQQQPSFQDLANPRPRGPPSYQGVLPGQPSGTQPQQPPPLPPPRPPAIVDQRFIQRQT